MLPLPINSYFIAVKIVRKCLTNNYFRKQLTYYYKIAIKKRGDSVTFHILQ